MKLTEEQLIYLTDIAKNAAKKAANLIAEYRQKDVEVKKKEGGFSLAAQVVTEVDRLSQEIILSELEHTLSEFDLGLLTEESDDDGSRLEKDYFWCIDPLDGTLCFTEKRPGYSVSIALVSKEGIAQLGVVVNAVDQTIYHVIKGKGAFKNGNRIEPAKISKDQFTWVCDQGFMNSSHYEEFLNYFKKLVFNLGYQNFKIIEGGGAVLNALYVLESSPSCYFKMPKQTKGGGSFWDYASTNCIFNELSVISCDFLKAPLNLNKSDSVFMNTNGVIYSTDELVRDVVIEMYERR